MDIERKLFIDSCVNDKTLLKAALSRNCVASSKTSETSEKARKEGNELFLIGNHDARLHREIFSQYCKSIALAPVDSQELAFAYGNRSVFLMHVNKYQESIQDIDRALNITNSNTYKIKLLCRKIECLKTLGSHGYQNVLETVESCIHEIDEKETNKEDLLKLIEKAKIFSVNSEQNFNNEEDTETECLKILSEREMDDVLNSVAINCNDKYGRHLVAARDFQPGEIIFVEKLYATVLNFRKQYTSCNYCFKTAWTGIPCDNCSWALFCSGNCKREANKKFHDVECTALPCAAMLCYDFVYFYHICIRMLILGIKEAGSIANLRAEIESVDKCTEPCSKGFIKDGKCLTNTFRSVYTLKSDNVHKEMLENFSQKSLFVLICMIKYAPFFQKSFNLEETTDLTENEDFVFLGSLLIKLCEIKSNNAHFFSYLIIDCEELSDLATCKANLCCIRGSCIAPLSSLINHSCFPNASRCFTEDQKSIVYALQPIKKNSQIFNAYSCFFYNVPSAERQEYMKPYNFSCDCLPCSENWPSILKVPEELKKKFHDTTEYSTEIQLYNDYKEIFKSLGSRNNHFDQETINKISEGIIQAIENLKQPSEITCLLIEALQQVFSHIYGLKPQEYGECKS